jgi:pyridoxine 5-phosphate synthase
MPLLAVNIDHVATIRQARGGADPEPLAAAQLAVMAGARGIIVHLREDRRHIQDRDVELLRRTTSVKFNLEMAATSEMQAIALDVKPDSVCLVPEKREELTTEGGLNCVGRESELADYLAPLHEAGIDSSLFIDADPRQIEAARSIGAKYVEIHTGHYADATTPGQRDDELSRILEAIRLGREADLLVNLGHGLNYHNVFAFERVPGVSEYSIGHAIVSRAVLTGMVDAVERMATIIDGFTD